MSPSGIDTAKLYPILMSSGLPREALGQIWASANRTTPGMLTKEELYTVLALIGVAQVNSWVKAKNPLGWISWIMPVGSCTASSRMPLCKVKIKRAFPLKHCKLSIFLSSNLLWRCFLSSLLVSITTTLGRMEIYKQLTKHCLLPLPCKE